jgi:hypothetical protein
MGDAFYKVPVFDAQIPVLRRGGRLGVTVRLVDVEEGFFDKALASVAFGMVALALAIAAGGQLPQSVPALAAAWIAGWAGNNARIAARCDRVASGGEPADG